MSTEKTPQWVINAETDIRKAIDKIDEKRAADIYALSFLIDCLDDDLRRISVILGYNTIKHYKESIPDASDKDEAKWNYAFWPENELLVVGGDNPVFQEWVRQCPGYCSVEEESQLKGQERKDSQQMIFEIGDRFEELIIPILRKLHEDGTILKKFGRDIPVLLHELEYSDETIEWAKATNPNGQAKEFIKWIRNM